MSGWISHRSPRARRVSTVLAAAAVAAGGMLVGSRTLGGLGDGDPPLAHLWVDADGGSCARAADPVEYDGAAACGSFGDAYAAASGAAAASTILVKEGTYGEQTIAGSRSASGRITIQPAPGERVQLAGKLTLGGAGAAAGPAHVTIRGIETAEVGDGYETPENRWGVYVLAGTTEVELDGIRAGNVAIFGATDVVVKESELGPCRASKPDSIPGSGPCTINYVDFGEDIRPERITYDGVLFRGYDYAESCVAAGDCHYRSMYLNGVKDVTIRNSTFARHVFEPWLTVSGPSASAVGNHDILVENNQFGANVQAGAGHGFAFAWCQNYTGTDAAYGNVTFRFNSFAKGVDVAVPAANDPEAEGDCTVSSFEVYGNIFGRKHSSCGLPAVRWSYNVYAGSNRGTCGTGDVALDRPTMPFYREDTTIPATHDDFALAGGPTAADDLVPIEAGCPETDRSGRARPQNERCDAGAHERDVRRR